MKLITFFMYTFQKSSNSVNQKLWSGEDIELLDGWALIIMIFHSLYKSGMYKT